MLLVFLISCHVNLAYDSPSATILAASAPIVMATKNIISTKDHWPRTGLREEGNKGEDRRM